MSFTAFKSEGGLLPLDLLDQVAMGAVAGQRPIDFGLDKNRRLTDEIAAAWADARDLWRIYQRALGRLREGDPGTTATRAQWIIPLLQLLGYTDLIGSQTAAVVEGKTYAISHWAGSLAEGFPVHIAGWHTDLDRREEGRARLAPHGLVQEFLNRTERLWGLVTNGRRLRVLRDSAKLTRPTFLEIDLEQIMAGEKYAEFALLYRLLHRSRLPHGLADTASCLLEQYHQEALSVGGRVRERLRDGVEEAVRELGTGFLSHPANDAVRDRLDKGTLTEGDFYRQLLRLIYRVLFLMVAEERNLVGPESPEKQEIYLRYYSISRLRTLAERFVMGAERYADLWRQLRATFTLYRSEAEGVSLEISPLDGDLFGPDTIPDLEGAELSNQHLITAMRRLSLYQDEKVLRRVNYGALDVEELGSVYESLLEYKPRVRPDGTRSEFELVAGSERRATGSYYTHPELVHQLIVHTLDPVIANRKARGTLEEQERELLSITVCDIACGSGHFLLAAARRIAGELAALRSREDQVKPEVFRKALRDVIQHCIYGVDLNPLAVDLCKVALWLEALNKGRPLNFLDHRIRCGNSLVGCTPDALAKGIPDEAYKPLAGDDKKVAAALKKRNRGERTRLENRHIQLAFDQSAAGRGGYASSYAALDVLSEDSTVQVHEKAARFEQARRPGTSWHKEWTACNLWTAPFFMPKAVAGSPVPTTETVTYYLAELGVEERLVRVVNCVSQDERRFFHWPLEFPEVMERGGFDVVIGNPPFLGGLKISTLQGPEFLNWLHTSFEGAGGTADLCAYFFRRAFDVLRQGGNLGLIATNTIAQGDTRTAGLEAIEQQGGTITFAVPSIKWPGDANLQVALVAVHKGAWAGDRILEGRVVPYITPLLDDGAAGSGMPVRLKANGRHSFIGSFVLGTGFIMQLHEAEILITRHPRNREVLFPYLVGEDLNGRPDQSPSRWVINFKEMTLEQAEKYHDCLSIVREKVKPHRDTVTRARNRERWWMYAETRPGLYGTIAGMRRVLVTSLVTKHLCFTFVPTGMVFGHVLGVLAYDDDLHFAVLQSTLHDAWARKHASTMRTDLRYTPSDCFETFPLPAPTHAQAKSLNQVGAAYHEHRRQAMLARQLGLTKLYNLFHDPTCSDSNIAELRRLHSEMDRTVLAAYGWSGIDLAHDFYGQGPETRFTIASDAKSEVLRRLLDLNHQRAAEERT